MMLSDHFSIREATRSDLATRLGINNTLPNDLVPVAMRTANRILEPIRAHFGIPFAPNSFYRCLELNRALGSKDTSQHVKAEAVDVELPGIPNLALAHWCAEHLAFDQLLLEGFDGTATGGWVHISYTNPNDNRHQILTIGQGGTTLGLPK